MFFNILNIEIKLKIKTILLSLILLSLIIILINNSSNIIKITKWINNNHINNFLSFITLLVTSFLWYVWYKFNKTSLYRTEMAFEEFRPHLIFELNDDNNVILKNIWQFEASNISLYYYLDENNLRFSKVDDLESSIISPSLSSEIKYKKKVWYYTFIVFYSNLSSWKYYLSWINYYFKDSLLNIWEDYLDEDLKKIRNWWIEKDKFISILNSLNIEKQIKKTVNPKDIISNFEKEYSN